MREPVVPLLLADEANALHLGLPRLGQGYVWQELHPGQQFRSFARTVTEADLVSFIGVTGMLEAIFIEPGYEGAAMAGRPVPGALTYCLIEGLLLQSMLQGTGLAMLELQQSIYAPVCVGDTVQAVVEVGEIRPSAKSGRAVVSSRIDVWNQRNVLVMSYTAKRLLAGQPQTSC